MDRSEEGFTLVEVIVTLAVMLILAAAITPSVLGVLDRQRIDVAAATLRDVSNSIIEFKDSVQRYPYQLQHLAEPITTSDLNSCQSAYAGADSTKWDATGPYMNRLVPASGLLIPIGTANDTLLRTPPTGGTGVLQIRVANVPEADILTLDEIVDGAPPVAGTEDLGTVRWSTPPVNGYVTLFYTMPVGNC